MKIMPTKFKTDKIFDDQVFRFDYKNPNKKRIANSSLKDQQPVHLTGTFRDPPGESKKTTKERP